MECISNVLYIYIFLRNTYMDTTTYNVSNTIAMPQNKETTSCRIACNILASAKVGVRKSTYGLGFRV